MARGPCKHAGCAKIAQDKSGYCMQHGAKINQCVVDGCPNQGRKTLCENCKRFHAKNCRGMDVREFRETYVVQRVDHKSRVYKAKPVAASDKENGQPNLPRLPKKTLGKRKAALATLSTQPPKKGATERSARCKRRSKERERSNGQVATLKKRKPRAKTAASTLQEKPHANPPESAGLGAIDGAEEKEGDDGKTEPAVAKTPGANEVNAPNPAATQEALTPNGNLAPAVDGVAVGQAKPHETVTTSLEKDDAADNGGNNGLGGTEAVNDGDKRLAATPCAAARLGASNETHDDDESEASNGGDDIDFDYVFDENAANAEEPEASDGSVPDERAANQDPKADGMVGVAVTLLQTATANPDARDEAICNGGGKASGDTRASGSALAEDAGTSLLSLSCKRLQPATAATSPSCGVQKKAEASETQEMGAKKAKLGHPEPLPQADENGTIEMGGSNEEFAARRTPPPGQELMHGVSALLLMDKEPGASDERNTPLINPASTNWNNNGSNRGSRVKAGSNESQPEEASENAKSPKAGTTKSTFETEGEAPASAMTTGTKQMMRAVIHPLLKENRGIHAEKEGPQTSIEHVVADKSQEHTSLEPCIEAPQEKATRNFDSSKEQICVLNQQLSNARKLVQGLQEELWGRSNEVSSLSAENAVAKRHAQEAMAKLQELIAICDAADEASGTREEMQAKITTLNNDLSDAIVDIHALREELARTNSLNHRLRHEAEETESRAFTAENRIEELKGHLRDTRDVVKRLETKMKAERQGSANTISFMSAQLAASRSEAEENMAKAQELIQICNELDEVSGTREELHETLAQAMQEVKSLRGQLECLDGMLARSNSRSRKLRRVLGEVESNAEKERKVTGRHYHKEVKRFEEALKKSSSLNKELRSKLSWTRWLFVAFVALIFASLTYAWPQCFGWGSTDVNTIHDGPFSSPNQSLFGYCNVEPVHALPNPLSSFSHVDATNLQEEMCSMDDILITKEEHRDEIQSELGRTKEELAVLKEELSKVVEETGSRKELLRGYAKLQGRKKELEGEISTLQRDLSRTKNGGVKMQSLLLEKEKKIKLLERDLSKANSRNTMLEGKLSYLANLINMLLCGAASVGFLGFIVWSIYKHCAGAMATTITLEDIVLQEHSITVGAGEARVVQEHSSLERLGNLIAQHEFVYPAILGAEQGQTSLERVENMFEEFNAGTELIQASAHSMLQD